MGINQYAKAILAAIIAGLGSLQVALLDETVTASEWVVVALATISALGLVWGVPNASSNQPPE
jgi:hypothetical protein